MRQSNQTPESIESRLARYEQVLQNFHNPLDYSAAEIIGAFGEAIMTYMRHEYQIGISDNNRLEELTLYFTNLQQLLIFCEHEFHEEIPTRRSSYTHQITGRPDESYDLNAQ